MAGQSTTAIGMAMLVLCLAACQSDRSAKTFAEMNAAEVEAATRELQDACRARGIGTGSRAFDQCVKVEAVKRGYTRYDRR